MDAQRIQEAHDLLPDELRAVEEAYSVFRQHTAPFMVSVAAEMIDDLRKDVETNGPGHRVAFLGRDGTSLSLAVRELDPEFHARHCSTVTVSRAVAEAALQDVERNEGRSFPQIEAFRGARGKVDPDHVNGSLNNTKKMFQRNKVPLGRENSSVTLVDTSFKGTVQELMTEAYPETRFTGRYAFLSKSPDDPRPGAKTGYVFHQEAGEKWKGLPTDDLPEEVAQTFGNKDALGVIEETMHGPLDSPRRIDEQGPDQRRQRDIPNPAEGINPVKVSPEYRSPKVREAVKDVALEAVKDVAGDYARKRDAGQDWKGELMRAREAFTHEVRAWVGREPTQDPRLSPLLDSFVRRTDKGEVKELAGALEGRDLSPQALHRTWSRFDQLEGSEAKKKYTAQVGRAMSGGAEGSPGFGPGSSQARSSSGQAAPGRGQGSGPSPRRWAGPAATSPREGPSRGPR